MVSAVEAAMTPECSLKARAEALTEWIADNGDGCAEKQRHLDAGTPERVYWHYGYLMALRDVMGRQKSTPHYDQWLQ
ncbi:hypothetical protein LCGC14_3002770 [marine sediment metagenome]|uniref:Uncharacterized protein n=1 Tax=marine sediment metagenome TaxID=412755 RepID=A0A0F8Z854_9ZZZZ